MEDPLTAQGEAHLKPPGAGRSTGRSPLFCPTARIPDQGSPVLRLLEGLAVISRPARPARVRAVFIKLAARPGAEARS